MTGGEQEIVGMDKLLEVLNSLTEGVWEIYHELFEVRKALLLPERNKEWQADSEARRRRGL